MLRKKSTEVLEIERPMFRKFLPTVLPTRNGFQRLLTATGSPR